MLGHRFVTVRLKVQSRLSDDEVAARLRELFNAENGADFILKWDLPYANVRLLDRIRVFDLDFWGRRLEGSLKEELDDLGQACVAGFAEKRKISEFEARWFYFASNFLRNPQTSAAAFKNGFFAALALRDWPKP